jgi:hypothetical protein
MEWFRSTENRRHANTISDRRRDETRLRLLVVPRLMGIRPVLATE